ncbi:hypothetical protein L226DRAFT_566970 [Lentinus tigrinus ALCF2SS1-7]|uniref:Transmembrane protein n=1 Tax=Lentinus tigrinus ALCF2SS1-6 TaxID=1328759 RepID=A0A5C2STC9_9APHY|nr:hypothetical protein L227DRAFT_606633 [Lentinus tigrinus ALCF2SS1-6]RPD80485.1 hypothetical protein L226DRAFT_566970 [Lentinus tigrinus ALCF2SS1-7]
MEHLSSYLLTGLALSLSANAITLRVRADPTEESQDPILDGDEENGPDGHLNEPWVVAVAVSVAVIVCLVAGIIIAIKLRQRRRNRNRGRQNYGRTADELAAAGVQGPPYQQAWKGPYASRSSYTRSPSPPSPAHLVEKDRWAPPQR